jgi:hypothetical protein
MVNPVEAKITGLLTAQGENEGFSLINLGCSEKAIVRGQLSIAKEVYCMTNFVLS